MAEQLAANGFSLPLEVAFYGPGGTPFAYPPLGIYLMAVACGPLGVPIMTYARWFPGLFSVVLTLVVYVLVRRLTGSRWIAAVALVLVMTNRTILDFHCTTAGVVRGPALAFSVAGVWAALLVMRGPRLSAGRLAAAAGLFGLTLLSHLSYAVFLALSLVVVAWVGGGRLPWRRRLTALAVISGGGVLLACPWWLTVMRNWGLSPFVSAVGSHDGFGALSAVTSKGLLLPRALGSSLVVTLESWSPAVVPGLAMAGFALLAVRRQWLIPLWALATYFGVGESNRYLALVGGIAAALLLGAIAGWESPDRPGRPAVVAMLPAVLVAGTCLVVAAHGRYRTGTVLSPELLEAASWVRAEAPPGARYLEFTGDHNAGEWLPYLTRRTPIVAPWGSEWNGRRDRQLRLHEMLVESALSQRSDLTDSLLQLPDVEPDLLIIPVSSTALVDHLRGVGWAPTHRNAGYVVLSQMPPPLEPGPEVPS